MSADTMRKAFRAPCLLIVPSNVVHSFESDQTSRGSALTVSDADRDELVRREPDLGRIFARPRVLEIFEPAVLEDTLARLARELGWMAPAHSMAVEALLATVLIEALRLTHRADEEYPPKLGSHAALVASFRALVEERYRSETRIEAYADAMNIQSKRLRSACMRSAGISPSDVIRNRLMLEAKRVLLYTNMTISETAYYLGYDDPAYFTRVFTKSCGVSPKNFRKDSTQPALSE
jgi:AraC family transcriptional activator of pobA